MKKYILAALVCVFTLSLSAQTKNDSIKRNSVYLELLGSAPLYYNLTYDRLIVVGDKIKFSGALGLQYIFNRESDSSLNSDFSMTPQFNFLYGSKHYLELGAGAAVQFGQTGVVFPLRIGYRFQRDNGGLFFKAAFTPNYYPGGFFGGPFLPWGGLCVGYTF